MKLYVLNSIQNAPGTLPCFPAFLGEAIENAAFQYGGLQTRCLELHAACRRGGRSKADGTLVLLIFLLGNFAEVMLHIWKLQTSALASSFLPASSMPARPLPAGAEAAGKRPAAGGGAASPARLHLHAPPCRVTGRRRRIRRGAAWGWRRRRQPRSWRLQGPAQQGARLCFALSTH